MTLYIAIGTHLLIGLVLALMHIYRERSLPKYDWQRGIWFWVTLTLWPLMLVVAIVMTMLNMTGLVLRKVFKANSMIKVELDRVSEIMSGRGHIQMRDVIDDVLKGRGPM